MTPIARISSVCCGALSLAAISAATWPLEADDREHLFEIPRGTFARRMAGDPVEILPSEIQLVLGLNDILLLRNLDDVPQVFGPTLIMPGQSLRLPFDTASENQFVCSAHQSGQMTIIVKGGPSAHWSRLRFRTGGLLRTVSELIGKESAS